MTKQALSEMVNTSASNVVRLLQRKRLDVYLLHKISNVLNYNFFKHFQVKEDEESDDANSANDKKLMEQFNSKIESQNIELRILKQENEYLKEINDLMKITLRPTLVRLRSERQQRKSLATGAKERLMIGEGK